MEGNKMKIDRIYYEELRSDYIDEKWTNKKVGMGATIRYPQEDISMNLDELKVRVRFELNKDDTKPNYEEKYKQLLKDTVKNIEKEIEYIEDDIPF